MVSKQYIFPFGIMLIFTLNPRDTKATFKMTMQFGVLRGPAQLIVGLEPHPDFNAFNHERFVAIFRQALDDRDERVRGTAASALGKIDDRVSLEKLREMTQKDGSKFVRIRSTQAVGLIMGGINRSRLDANYFITIGNIINQTSVKNPKFTQAFKDALLTEFKTIPKVITSWDSPKGPTIEDLKKYRLQAYLLHGTLLKLTKKKREDQIELGCNANVILASRLRNQMIDIYIVGASLRIPERDLTPNYQDQLFVDAIRWTARSAMKEFISGRQGH